MNSVPATDQMSVSLLLMLLIAIGLIVFLSIAISGRRRPENARSFAKLLVVGALLLAIVVGIKWTRGIPMQTTARLGPQGAAALRSVPLIESRDLESPSSPAAGELESAKSEVKRPEWTRQHVRIDGDRKLIVVSSGRFASEEEAELHGFQQATATAVKEFSSLDPRGIGAVQPQHTGIVKETAIKIRFMETIAEWDFGKFKAPMHQLWLQVELTPELGERLAEPWRQAAIEARLRTLTGWGLWGTAAAALAAFTLRLDAAWNGRRRAVVAGTAIALTLGSLAFVA